MNTKKLVVTIAISLLAHPAFGKGIIRRVKDVVKPSITEVKNDVKDGVHYGSYPVRKVVGHPKVSLRFVGRAIGRVIY